MKNITNRSLRLGKIAEYKDKLEALDTLEPHPQSTLSFLKEDGTSD